jgi:hypothetical protein
MSVNNEVASTALLSITASISVFNSLCPPLHDVRRATGGDIDVINDVRVAEIAAVSLTVAIGVTGSSLTNNPLPAALSILAAAALVVMYESVLRSEPNERKGTVKL